MPWYNIAKKRCCKFRVRNITVSWLHKSMLLKNCYVARKARERNPIAKKILIVTSAYARPYTLWGGGGGLWGGKGRESCVFLSGEGVCYSERRDIVISSRAKRARSLLTALGLSQLRNSRPHK